MISDVLWGFVIAVGIFAALFVLLGAVSALATRLRPSRRAVMRLPGWAKIMVVLVLVLILVWQIRALLEQG